MLDMRVSARNPVLAARMRVFVALNTVVRDVVVGDEMVQAVCMFVVHMHLVAEAPDTPDEQVVAAGMTAGSEFVGSRSLRFQLMDGMTVLELQVLGNGVLVVGTEAMDEACTRCWDGHVGAHKQPAAGCTVASESKTLTALVVDTLSRTQDVEPFQ